MNVNQARNIRFWIGVSLAVSLLFLVGTLVLAWGINDRLPSRFMNKRFGPNIYIYVNAFILAAYALLIPAFLKLKDLRKKLKSYSENANSESNLDFGADIKNLIIRLIFPWIIYSIFLAYMGIKMSQMTMMSI